MERFTAQPITAHANLVGVWDESEGIWVEHVPTAYADEATYTNGVPLWPAEQAAELAAILND